MKQPVFIGADFGKDEAVEVVCKLLPDGTTEVVSFHRYKNTIDLEKVRELPPPPKS